MSDLEAQTRGELESIVAVLTELTGLTSRWSGQLELVPEAGFKGKKPFRCDILIDEGLARQEIRWTTLIHEALHSFSAGYLRDDYQNFQGWEEGVVEQLQRLLRPSILAAMNVTVSEGTLRQLEEGHAYNGFIDALETLRRILKVSDEEKQHENFTLPCSPRRSGTGAAFSSTSARRCREVSIVSSLARCQRRAPR
jgi:hypothetical protein